MRAGVPCVRPAGRRRFVIPRDAFIRFYTAPSEPPKAPAAPQEGSSAGTEAVERRPHRRGTPAPATPAPATPAKTAALLRLALLRQQAEEHCRALAPPASGEWSREDEAAFERASAFSDGIEAAIEALTGSRNGVKRTEMLTVPQAAEQLSRLLGIHVHEDRLTWALRVGNLGGIKVGGRWYVSKSSLRGYCGGT